MDLKPLGLAVLLLAAAPAFAQMYKCVDEKGKTQYSDKPGPNCKGGAVQLQAPPPPAPAASESAKGGAVPKNAEERKRQAMARVAEERKRECAANKAELQRFTASKGPVKTVDTAGEPIWVTGAARDAKAAQLRADVAETCR